MENQKPSSSRVLRRDAVAARKLRAESAAARAARRMRERGRDAELRQVIREEKARGGKDARVLRP